jgi:hypothetical protein
MEAQLATAQAEGRSLRAELERVRSEVAAQREGAERQVGYERQLKADSMAALWTESSRLHGDEAGRLREERQLADEQTKAALRRQVRAQAQTCRAPPHAGERRVGGGGGVGVTAVRARGGRGGRRCSWSWSACWRAREGGWVSWRRRWGAATRRW